MSVRRLLAGVAATSVAAASLAVASPAQADPGFVPGPTDIVGAGSDTSMYALTYLAEGHSGVPGYNAGRATGRLVSFDAKIFDAAGAQTNSTTVVLREGSAAITRPNGSTEGKNLLRPATNNPDVNYARSSSGLSAAEASDGLVAFPFAKDTLGMATAKTSNAPASLTAAQIVGIYKGEITNWTQVGGSAGTIVPLIPQDGSGTRSFFEGELKRMNGGTAVTVDYTKVQKVQEHDDTPVKNNPNAVAPFSFGRAELLGTLRMEGGLAAGRALYNVVRQADVNSAWAQDLFGPNGFLCKPAATSLILDSGFEQLLSQSQGGKCGVTTTSSTAPSDLLTAKVSTSTTVAGTSASAGALALTSTIAGGGQIKPQGTVAFLVDGVVKGNAIVTGGKAVLNLTGIAAGSHQVVARFTPSGAAFNGSESPATAVNVLAATPASPVATLAVTKIKEAFKASYNFGTVVKGAMLIKESAAGAATGTVKVKRGSKVVAKAKVKNGKAILKLQGLKKGVHKLVATYSGDKNFAKSKLKFKITVK